MGLVASLMLVTIGCHVYLFARYIWIIDQSTSANITGTRARDHAWQEQKNKKAAIDRRPNWAKPATLNISLEPRNTGWMTIIEATKKRKWRWLILLNWNKCKHVGHIWAHLGTFGHIWAHLGRAHSGTFDHIRAHSGTFGHIRAHMGTYREHIWAQLGTGGRHHGAVWYSQRATPCHWKCSELRPATENAASYALQLKKHPAPPE